MRFSEAIKKRSQVVATDKGIKTGALEDVQDAEKESPTPVAVQQPKKRSKNKKK